MMMMNQKADEVVSVTLGSECCSSGNIAIEAKTDLSKLAAPKFDDIKRVSEENNDVILGFLGLHDATENIEAGISFHGVGQLWASGALSLELLLGLGLASHTVCRECGHEVYALAEVPEFRLVALLNDTNKSKWMAHKGRLNLKFAVKALKRV